MVFRLDLDLEAMLSLAGWDGEKANNCGRRISSLWDEAYELPYTFSYAARLTGRTVVSTAVYFQQYHTQFLRTHFRDRNTFGVANRYLIQFYSESLSNILAHGGQGVGNEDTVIQLYHPSDPSRFVLRIHNPAAEIWDPHTMGSNGRGGYRTFLQEFASVSYGDEGREFLALITPPLRS